MRRNWIKIYIDQCLRGTMMDEMKDPAERFVWFGFLLLAGDSAYEGRIALTEDMGYSDEQLGAMLKCDAVLIKKAKKKMIKYEKIKILKNNIIQILNWSKYQSEYQRQKPYRSDDGQKLLRKVTTKGNDIEGEGEGEGDRDINREGKDNIYSIIEHWNSQGIKTLEERESNIRKKTSSKIAKQLKDYPVDEIYEAIGNYSIILKDDKYFFSYSWQLWEFLDRGLVNFLTKNEPFKNYLSDKDKGSTKEEKRKKGLDDWVKKPVKD